MRETNYNPLWRVPHIVLWEEQGALVTTARAGLSHQSAKFAKQS